MICKNNACIEEVEDGYSYCSEECAMEQRRFEDFVDDEPLHDNCFVCGTGDYDENDEC